MVRRFPILGIAIGCAGARGYNGMVARPGLYTMITHALAPPPNESRNPRNLRASLIPTRSR